MQRAERPVYGLRTGRGYSMYDAQRRPRRRDAAITIQAAARLDDEAMCFHRPHQPPAGTDLDALGTTNVATDLTEDDELEGAHDALDNRIFADYQ